VLGRITRLRRAGRSLQAIRPLLAAGDEGAALRAALQDLDDALANEIEQLQCRRALIEALRASSTWSEPSGELEAVGRSFGGRV
jgi:DNA-binding transcriptional MerR regulator